MKTLRTLFLTVAGLLVLLLTVSASILDNAIDTEAESKSSEESGKSAEPVKKYEPNWESLDARPLPAWYDQSKIGIFLHWGVFSVPSFGSEWFWHYLHEKLPDYVSFMQKNYPPNFTYQDFASQFTAEFYNASEWVELFAKAGARYVVLTSKHHEGFTNWPSKYSFNWNSMAVGPHRDLVGELADAVRASSSGIHFGLYHSLFEWYNPLYLQDQANSFKTDMFARSKTMPELYELVNAYKPEVIWSDGDAADAEYWKSQEFIAWLYNDSPVKDVVVINDRWGTNTSCKHGGFYNCMDRYHPYKVQDHKWENAFTLDKNSWGYRRNGRLEDYLNIVEIISTLVTTVACGGNVLINVGPTRDGVIAPIFQERLLEMGAFLRVNGEAIYETQPWLTAQNDTTSGYVWYTTKPKQNKLYAIALRAWGSNWTDLTLGSVVVKSTKEIEHIQLLAAPGVDLHWKPITGGGILIQLPEYGAITKHSGVPYGKAFEITFTDKRQFV